MPSRERLTLSPPLFRPKSPELTVTFTARERALAAEIRSVLLRYDVPERGEAVPRAVSGRLHARSLVASELRGDLLAFTRRDVNQARPRLYAVLLAALVSVRLTELRLRETAGSERP